MHSNVSGVSKCMNKCKSNQNTYMMGAAKPNVAHTKMNVWCCNRKLHFCKCEKSRQIFSAKQKIEILTELDFLSVLFYLGFEKSNSNVICNTSM